MWYISCMHAILILQTIPSGPKTASSGSAVVLTVKQNKEVVNRKLADMCKPDWEKLQAQGVDVVGEARHYIVR